MATGTDTRRSLVPPLRPVRSERRPRPGDGDRVPHGRYDGRKANTRRPPGGDLATPPRDAVRAKLEKRLERTRKQLRGLAGDPVANYEAIKRLRDEERDIATMLAGELGVRSATAAVVDPMGDGAERILATVNRRTDILEEERSHDLISEAAYRNGRLVQGIMEKAGRIGGSNWAGSSRKDAGEVRDMHAQRMIDDGRAAEAWRRRIRDRIGMIDARLLDRVLGDGLSYTECAALVGRTGDRGMRYVAARFRDALEDLSEGLAIKGRALSTPHDKHLAAAGVASMRQALAIVSDVTLERLQAELEDLAGREVKTAEIRRDIEWLQQRLQALRQAKAGRAAAGEVR